MPRLEFSGHESTLHKALVVAFDLGGFSAFCNQPDPLVAAAVPQLDKRMFDLLNETLDIREEPFLLPVILTDEKATNPNFTKFTGDGALLFWLRSMKEDFPQPLCNWLVESMRRFQRELSAQLPVWEKEWRVHKVPRQVRVGIATGVVYALRRPHSVTSLTEPCDFVGYCVNLAVRLQNYCPELGFAVHATLHPELGGMKRYTATTIKGGQTEPVVLFTEDVARVPEVEFMKKFRPLESR